MSRRYPFVAYLRGIFYSLPTQLLFLHFRKYQVLLVFWFILFSTVNGTFMKIFGADSLFLAPEYLGNVNSISAAIMGIAVGIFIMCWNITTFILFSRHFTFLAATQYPFVKYCINNSAIPLGFLIFFFIKGYRFAHYKELISNTEIIFLFGGFLVGLFLILLISFSYFFRADKTILKRLQPYFVNATKNIKHGQSHHDANSLIRSEWFLDSFFSYRRCRDVSHYSQELMGKIFKQHHFAAVLSILFIILFLIITGFFLEYSFFQIPAAASITLFFAILIGISGAVAYFLQSWSVPFLIFFLLFLNFLYRTELIDPRNKAYGLDYNDKSQWPDYNMQTIKQLCGAENIEHDKQNMVNILNKWKQKQQEEKPLLVLITTSGGGNRSAAFTMDVLQRLDRITEGKIMRKTFLITGASGGMIGATYFRELYLQKICGKNIDLQNKKYIDNISEDLLNPTFSSFVARDIFAPAQHFSVGPYTYLKDRAYSFEMKLNSNTGGILNRRLKDYVQYESSATIPLIFYHSVITRDAKKVLISTQPLRFMMLPLQDSSISSVTDPDVIDFTSFFANQNPYNLRMLTALRMNATFPIVLPSVWLPSQPIIDVMDGGLRDNYGVENSLRFVSAMSTWIKENTRGVLIIQMRDRLSGGWENPYELKGIGDHTIKPFMLLQHNWSKMMEYFQNDMFTYFSTGSGFPIHRVVFNYASKKEENTAALNFHLTQREKRDIISSIETPHNRVSFSRVMQLISSNTVIANGK
ncbi:MAG: patatin-like phospholipase family protein [Chitinophagaceae bacterium]|nr:patatin-like phospholipase family protein [Chitinophagaceae bacterium]